jgi:hypothetical protein
MEPKIRCYARCCPTLLGLYLKRASRFHDAKGTVISKVLDTVLLGPPPQRQPSPQHTTADTRGHALGVRLVKRHGPVIP